MDARHAVSGAKLLELDELFASTGSAHATGKYSRLHKARRMVRCIRSEWDTVFRAGKRASRSPSKHMMAFLWIIGTIDVVIRYNRDGLAIQVTNSPGTQLPHALMMY